MSQQNNIMGDAQALSQHLIEKKAKSILRRLQVARSMLCPLECSASDKSNRIFGIAYGTRQQDDTDIAHDRPMYLAKNSAVKITENYVSAFYAKQWLERCGKDAYCLSDTGDAWLKRKRAKHSPFQEQHHILQEQTRVDADKLRRMVVVNETESPLGWLRKRKNKAGKGLIDEYQYEAGERLRSDFTHAQLMPRITTDWSFSGAGEQKRKNGSSNRVLELRDSVLAAKKRVGQALQAIGPEFSGIIIDVCCHLKGLEEAEKAQGWPQRSGKIVLQLALNSLARHYGYVSEGNRQSAEYQQILHWGNDDYRPQIE
ncbi:MAG: DUF6456 domain-containing protein [Pseudomonadota bacterium]